MLSKDTAICIHAIDYSETSQIVTFFTRENGKVGAIAKGSKRAKSSFEGPIELFSHGKIVFSHKPDANLATLTEFNQKAGLAGLTINLFSMNCALFAAELINKLTDNFDVHSELFDNFEEFLHNISDSKSSSDTLTLLIVLQLSILKEIGLQPMLNKCVNCKTSYELQSAKNEIYFSSSANGIICRDCEANFTDKIRLSQATADCLANLKLLADTNEKVLNEIEKILIYHFTELLHQRPRMAKYIVK